MRQYVLTRQVLNRLLSRYGFILCLYCGKPIKPNQKIIAIVGKGKTKRYHKECYEKTLH